MYDGTIYEKWVTRQIHAFQKFFILGSCRMSSSSSSDSGTELISLKQSPLTIMLQRMWSRFPEFQFSLVERTVLESKCDLQRSEENLLALLQSTPGGVPVYASSDRKEENTSIQRLRPQAEMRVYRLDTDSPGRN